MYKDTEDASNCLVEEGFVKSEPRLLHSNTENKKHVNNDQRVRPLLLRLLVGFFALWGCVDASVKLIQGIRIAYNAQKPACWCGETDAEAISMGCRYDHLAVDWLPESCIDQELVKQFDNAGPRSDGSWPYYALVERPESLAPHFHPSWPPEYQTNRYPTSLVPINDTVLDSFAARGETYYTTREWHIQHCLYTWRKQLRSVYNARLIEPWNMREEHVQHCMDYITNALKNRLPLDTIETTILGADRHTGEL